VGTGSGNIAISLAIAIPNAKIYAIEKDKDALTLAKENIATYKLDKRINLFQGDLLTPLTDKVDIIVANLPYVPSSKIKYLQPEISKWEPRIALEGGADGLELYRRLFNHSKRILKTAGTIYYELSGRTHSKLL
ncbi:MAG: methyltransferase, partial [SAR324 cluster bacterium]|nr:methyltransferase [SAR324 cluster bacterium]